MQPLTYKTRRLSRQAKKGVSKPAIATLNAILTFDCDESPFGVYDELVAVRLGQLLLIPIASGVLTPSADGQVFAGIEIGSAELLLPDVLDSRLDEIAAKYPSEVAALVAFDLWIGNDDRGGNLKASLQTQHIRIFAGFDHAITLLGFSDKSKEIRERLTQLESGEMLTAFHPFFGRVDSALLNHWVARIEGLPDDLVRDCCVFDKPLRTVTLPLQEALAKALNGRKRLLRQMIASNAGQIGV